MKSLCLTLVQCFHTHGVNAVLALMAHYSRHVADTKLLKTKLAIRVFRVSARQVGARTVSVLTIASSLEEDSGNYTCTVPDLGLSASLEIIIQQESECYVNTASH